MEIHSLESIFTWWRAVIWSNDGRKRGGEATTEIAKIIKSSIKQLLYYLYWLGFLLKLRCFKSRAVSCRQFPGTECVSLLSSCVAAAPVKQLSTHVGLFCPTVAAPNSVPQPVCVWANPQPPPALTFFPSQFLLPSVGHLDVFVSFSSLLLPSFLDCWYEKSCNVNV